MEHLEITAQQLRWAYRCERSRPCAGTWRAEYEDIDGHGMTYRCPLNVLYGASCVDDAVDATHAPRACIVGFLHAWDLAYEAKPNECAQCFALGARLRAQLQPAWMTRR